MNPALKQAAGLFDGLAAAAAAKREPTDQEITDAFAAVMGMATLFVDAALRIAEAAERIASCERHEMFDINDGNRA